jgi:hypothetical protein
VHLVHGRERSGGSSKRRAAGTKKREARVDFPLWKKSISGWR